MDVEEVVPDNSGKLSTRLATSPRKVFKQRSWRKPPTRRKTQREFHRNPSDHFRKLLETVTQAELVEDTDYAEWKSKFRSAYVTASKQGVTRARQDWEHVLNLSSGIKKAVSDTPSSTMLRILESISIEEQEVWRRLRRNLSSEAAPNRGSTLKLNKVRQEVKERISGVLARHSKFGRAHAVKIFHSREDACWPQSYVQTMELLYYRNSWSGNFSELVPITEMLSKKASRRLVRNFIHEEVWERQRYALEMWMVSLHGGNVTEYIQRLAWAGAWPSLTALTDCTIVAANPAFKNIGWSPNDWMRTLLQVLRRRDQGEFHPEECGQAAINLLRFAASLAGTRKEHEHRAKVLALECTIRLLRELRRSKWTPLKDLFFKLLDEILSAQSAAVRGHPPGPRRIRDLKRKRRDWALSGYLQETAAELIASVAVTMPPATITKLLERVEPTGFRLQDTSEQTREFHKKLAVMHVEWYGVRNLMEWLKDFIREGQPQAAWRYLMLAQSYGFAFTLKQLTSLTDPALHPQGEDAAMRWRQAFEAKGWLEHGSYNTSFQEMYWTKMHLRDLYGYILRLEDSSGYTVVNKKTVAGLVLQYGQQGRLIAGVSLCIRVREFDPDYAQKASLMFIDTLVQTQGSRVGLIALSKFALAGVNPGLACFGLAAMKAENPKELQKIRSIAKDVGITKMASFVQAMVGFSTSVKEAMALLRRALEAGVEPTVGMFNAALEVTTRNAQLSEMNRILDAMKKVGVEPDAWTYAIQMNTSASLGRPDVAQALLYKAAGRFEPDQVLYGLFLKAVAKAGNVDAAMEVITNMKEQGLTSNSTLSRMYAGVIEAACKAGKMDIAEKFLEQLPVEPRCYHLSPLIVGYGKLGDVRKAESTFIALYDKDKEGLSTVHCNQLLTVYVTVPGSQHQRRASMLFDLMVRQGIPRNRKTVDLMWTLFGFERTRTYFDNAGLQQEFVELSQAKRVTDPWSRWRQKNVKEARAGPVL